MSIFDYAQIDNDYAQIDNDYAQIDNDYAHVDNFCRAQIDNNQIPK